MRSVPISITLIFLFLLLAKPGSAQIMQEKNYQLRLETFSEKPTATAQPSKEVKPTTVPINLPSLPTYPANTESLNFLVTPGVIDFGIVHATTPVDRKIYLSSPTKSDFFIYTYINHGLQGKDSEIPQTSCDNGTCSTNVAAEWNSTLSFGLGYSCTGPGCDRDFKENEYRPFNLIPTSFAQPQEDENGLKNISMPVRLNVSATQKPENYENNIIILSVPAL